MLLGKRPRHPMRRTTSLSEFSLDLGGVENPQSSSVDDQDGNPPRQQRPVPAPPLSAVDTAAMMNNYNNNVRKHQHLQQPHHHPPRQHHQYQHQGTSDGLDTRYVSSISSPRNHRRSSADFAAVETAHFLRACGLCKRRLCPGRDIFMYRGEIAFCSLECRQQQINQDERKEKCSLTSVKKDSPQTAAAGGSDSSGNGETAAAA